MRRFWVLLACTAIVLIGCSPIAAAQPRPCFADHTAARCLAMTDQAAAEISKTRTDVVAIAIVPDPPPVDGILQTRGGATPLRIRISLADGSTHDAMMCGGVPSGPACMEEPKLTAGSAIGPGGGYRDVPCAGEPPDGCATPLPTLEPTAVDEAEPLTIARLDIPIDHLGAYQVPLGQATIANGILTEASLGLLDDWPADLAIADGAILIEVRSLEPNGKPFGNYYEHGWRSGVERIEAMLVFDVLWFDPGATLSIRDVLVR